ncbi:hypothetical protein [Myroides odoratimimus]|uniref:hypothetical protein n=1 Tax=Myroides odoratimimus TaxID=76832 RepID=UPI002575566C|nr:hypothetical protein [Myroides odoratimimus]MDM1454724.1 hypothetical protein [Myroides odoratimimus]MDM1478440.1 hypothetical protein [Myroides odoratimimus]MDM1490724.1 hypothetical protein [Myroides odoratimimus]
MKKTYIGFAGLSLLLLLGTQTVQAQQGFGTDKPNKSAAVDIQSSKRGLLIPRVNLKSTIDAKTIVSPAQSLMVYNQATTTSGTNDVTPGYYYWDIDRWARFAKQSEIIEIELKGDVTGKTGDTKVVAIQGTSISNVAPTANQVLTLVNGVWTPTTITPSLISDAKGITGTGITVGGTDNGAGSVLKEVTLSITHGEANQVMVTNADGNGTTWVDQKDIVKANETVTTIKEGTNITVTKAADSHEYTLDVPTATKDVAGVVKAGEGLNVDGTGNLTVNYETAKEKLAKGNVTSNSIVVNDDKGSVGSTFKDVSLEIKAGTNGQVMVTKEGKVTWVDQSDIVPTTTNDIKTEGTNIVTTVNNQKAELTLAGDVVLKNGETVVGGIQGTPVSETKPAAGQTLVYNTTTNTWEPGTPNVGVDNVTDGKDLTAADGDAATIEVVNGGLKAVLVETSLRVKEESITSKEIKNGTIKPEDVAKAGKNQVLVTDSSGVPTWKNQNKVAPQFFYMPAVIFDTKSKGTKLSRDLYKEYVDQFTGGKAGVGNAEYPIAHGAGGYTMPYTGGIVGSTDAPADIAVFDRGELHYYVTYYDTKVFANLSIDKDGKLTYDIIGNATPASYMNIVFVIK